MLRRTDNDTGVNLPKKIVRMARTRLLEGKILSVSVGVCHFCNISLYQVYQDYCTAPFRIYNKLKFQCHKDTTDSATEIGLLETNCLSHCRYVCFKHFGQAYSSLKRILPWGENFGKDSNTWHEKNTEGFSCCQSLQEALSLTSLSFSSKSSKSIWCCSFAQMCGLDEELSWEWATYS